MGWTIRRAEPDEADALSALALRSKAWWGYSDAFMARCAPLLAVTPEFILRWPTFVGVDAQGRLAGFYALQPRDDTLELGLLFIEPDFIGRGLGAALLAHATAQARVRGHDHLLIESDPGAEGFYLRAGARRIGWVASSVEHGRYLPLLTLDLSR